MPEAKKPSRPTTQNLTKTRLRRGEIPRLPSGSDAPQPGSRPRPPDAEDFLCASAAEQLEFDFPPDSPFGDEAGWPP